MVNIHASQRFMTYVEKSSRVLKVGKVKNILLIETVLAEAI